MMAVIALSALYAVVGEGARVKILLQCTTLLSAGRDKNNTANLFSGLFFSPDDHCINLLQSNKT